MDEFILNFVTDADVSINFEYSIVGEILGETGQVILAALILVLVLLLIIFDVSLCIYLLAIHTTLIINSVVIFSFYHIFRWFTEPWLP